MHKDTAQEDNGNGLWELWGAIMSVARTDIKVIVAGEEIELSIIYTPGAACTHIYRLTIGGSSVDIPYSMMVGGGNSFICALERAVYKAHFA